MANNIHCKYTKDTQVTVTVEGIADTLHTIHDGSGRYVTPGDMLVAALGACTLTMIGAVAQQFHQSIEEASVTLKPTFSQDGKGLQRVEMHLTLPPGTSEDMRRRCITAAQHCPVHKSLNPAIEVIISDD